MKKIFSLILTLTVFLFTISVTTAHAHPGPTDANGGHYCQTNCEKYGLKKGEYHYHNKGNSTTTPSIPKSKTNQPKSRYTLMV